MSTGTSVPRPRASGPDLSDSALLDTLLREAPIGFAFFGSDLRFRRVNQALAGLAGLDPAGHVGRMPAEVWPADLAAAAADALGRVLAGGLALESAPPEPGDLPAEPAGPGAHWSFSWYPSHDSDGLVAGVALIAVDHSRRHASAEDLRRSQERYRSLVQAGAQVIWVTTPDGRIAEDSPAWRWITGQSIDEFAASGWLDAVHPDDRERVEQEWADSLRSGQAFDSRYRIRSRSGSYRHYDVRAVAVERDGKIIEWVGASTDVTGQREAEEMRGRLTEQLSAAALRTARLQQATSMLAEALTVEQVVEVITEVGRTAIGALHSAVALLD
ncbi:MAG TPA: PAS domain-containing protein, partial [Streptosporangiaceae bacterium]|nr:PAS domain-containing protein [Streptosporangiaceae bacterium]